MKKYILAYSLLPIAYFFSSCSSNNSSDNTSAEAKNELIARIDSLQGAMFDPQNRELNKELASKGIAAYLEYIGKFPDDTLSSEYLFRLSDLSRGVGDNLNAIKYLEQITKSYPAFKRMPECLFLQGYYYQEYFNDTVQAKAFYSQLVSKYPNHAFADDAKALMQMFGKTEEDIIKEFEKKELEKKKI